MIKPGMLVEIICHDSNLKASDFNGHVGEVLRPCNVHNDSWDISGAESNPQTGNLISFESYMLRPIDDDQQASWDEIEKAIGWKPKELVAV